MFGICFKKTISTSKKDTLIEYVIDYEGMFFLILNSFPVFMFFFLI